MTKTVLNHALAPCRRAAVWLSGLTGLRSVLAVALALASRGVLNNPPGGQSFALWCAALLALSLCESAHLYLWDEPLNYIDVFSRMQIEQLLLSASPTMLVVDHDVRFQKKLATRTVKL